MTNPSAQKELEKLIKDNLQKAFKEKAEEEVPDRFLKLLDQLRQQEEEEHGPR